jgi:hypothetical protein
VLEGYRRRQEAFRILECLLGRSGPLQRFAPPPPSGDQLKVSELVHSWAKNGGKSLLCQKVLQLLDVLRGWEIFDFGSVIGVNGRTDKGVASLEQSKI